MPKILDSNLPSPVAREFRTTHWSVVLAAGNGGAVDSTGAFEALCRTYWYPLYAFVRRSGYAPHDAQDLTQGFFEHLVSTHALGHASPERGRFRTFLLAALKNFLANEWDHGRRLKRGGGREILSWDSLNPEERYALEPAHPAHPEAWYDRQWAQALIARVLRRLREELAGVGLEQRFEVLKDYLAGQPADSSYLTTAARLGLSEGAVKSAIFRLRRRYAEVVREEIAHTVATPDEVEAEIRHLFAACER